MKTILLNERKVTPIRKMGDKYTYKVGEFKGEWMIREYSEKYKTFVFGWVEQ